MTLGKAITGAELFANPEFANRYVHMQSSDSSMNNLIERPSLRELIGSLSHAENILDIGSGDGEFTSSLSGKFTGTITLIDSSPLLLNIARKRFKYKAECISADIENCNNINLKSDFYDLAISSLCLHYVSDISSIIRMISRSLKIGGRFVFSVKHPINTSYPSTWRKRSNQGILNSEEEVFVEISDYFNTGKKEHRFMGEMVYIYHRTIGELTDHLYNNGMLIERIMEPRSPDGKECIDNCMNLARRYPYFLSVSCIKFQHKS